MCVVTVLGPSGLTSQEIQERLFHELTSTRWDDTPPSLPLSPSSSPVVVYGSDSENEEREQETKEIEPQHTVSHQEDTHTGITPDISDTVGSSGGMVSTNTTVSGAVGGGAGAVSGAVSGGAGAVSGGAGAVSGGTGAVSGGTGAVSGGAGAVSGGTGAVSGGTGAVSGGTGAVSGGAGAVSGGTGAVSGGAGAVSGGAGAVSGGAGAVSGGTGAVSGGTGAVSGKCEVGGGDGGDGASGEVGGGDSVNEPVLSGEGVGEREGETSAGVELSQQSPSEPEEGQTSQDGSEMATESTRSNSAVVQHPEGSPLHTVAEIERDREEEECVVINAESDGDEQPRERMDESFGENTESKEKRKDALRSRTKKERERVYRGREQMSRDEQKEKERESRKQSSKRGQIGEGRDGSSSACVELSQQSPSEPEEAQTSQSGGEMATDTENIDTTHSIERHTEGSPLLAVAEIERGREEEECVVINAESDGDEQPRERTDETLSEVAARDLPENKRSEKTGSKEKRKEVPKSRTNEVRDGANRERERGNKHEQRKSRKGKERESRERGRKHSSESSRRRQSGEREHYSRHSRSSKCSSEDRSRSRSPPRRFSDTIMESYCVRDKQHRSRLYSDDYSDTGLISPHGRRCGGERSPQRRSHGDRRRHRSRSRSRSREEEGRGREGDSRKREGDRRKRDRDSVGSELQAELSSIDEEIVKHKREVLQAMLRSERLQLLHRQLQGRDLPDDRHDKLGEPLAIDETTPTGEVVNELAELDRAIVDEKRRVLRVMKRIEEEAPSSDVDSS